MTGVRITAPWDGAEIGLASLSAPDEVRPVVARARAAQPDWAAAAPHQRASALEANYRPSVVPFGGLALAGSGREGIGWTAEELTWTRFIAIRGIRPAGVSPVPAGAGDG